jgi:hypothetical protein
VTIRAFIDSIPPSGLYVDALRSIARSAGVLEKIEPDLVTPLTLIRLSFVALAHRWEGAEPLSPSVSDDVTPRIASAIKDALEKPAIETFDRLAATLNWAQEHPLFSLESLGLGQISLDDEHERP